ncbi:unnamed protein product [Orchesella dallaii]|uniref:CCHC-type domain-containing protein n=1 Tax=Orchesella dallaii TaxID=48710 RepID=A0ABP1RJL2_9HEXA
MAGNAPIFTADEAELAGLTQEQLEYLNRRVVEHVDNAVDEAGTIRVTTVNSRIDIPYYNPDTMSAASFFSKCEKYFRAQGFPVAQYHNMEAFANRFDKPSDRERRKRLLYSRKQKSESCEQFIQEMVTLARQIDEHETEHTSVLRAYNALHPEIILNTGSLDNLTINTLMEKLAFTYDAIRARDARNKVYTWLPPLYGYNAEKGPQFFQYGNRGRGRGQSRGNGFHTNSYSNRGPSTSQGNNFNSNMNEPPQNPNQHNMPQRSSNMQQYPPTFQHRNGQQQTQQQRTGYPPNNPNHRNGYQNSGTFDKSKIECRMCHRYGHYSCECPNNGVLNMATQDGNNSSYPYQDYSAGYQQQSNDYPQSQQNIPQNYQQQNYPQNNPQQQYSQEQNSQYDANEQEYYNNSNNPPSNPYNNEQHLNYQGGYWPGYGRESSQY